LKYPKLIKSLKLQNVFEKSLGSNILKKIQRENNIISTYYQKDNPNNINSSFNKRIIEESVNGTVSIIFDNLLSKTK
jgi:hypothetical protein